MPKRRAFSMSRASCALVTWSDFLTGGEPGAWPRPFFFLIGVTPTSTSSSSSSASSSSVAEEA